MDKELLDLVRISNTAGSDSSLVQGGGGNTSVKSDDGKYMYIKASGTALKDMSVERGWRRLNIAAVLDILGDKPLAKMDIGSRELEMVKRLLAACEDDVCGNVRPSVECPMHAVLSKCVIHLHATAVQAYTSAKNGKSEVFELFKDEQFGPLWVPYANPGFDLGQKVFRLVNGYVRRHGRKPGVLIMQKHGVLVSSQSADGALRLVEQIIGRCRAGVDQSEPVLGKGASKERIEECKQNIARALFEITGKRINISFCIDPSIEQFLASKHAGQMLRCGPLTPDELAFVDGAILWLRHCRYENVAEKIKVALSKEQGVPTSFLVKGVGLFIAAESALVSVVRDIVIGSLYIRRKAHKMGGINALSSRERDFIENWEAEQFRVQLAAGKG